MSQENSSKEEMLELVREHVLAAASILKSLDKDSARVAWLLEDALEYLRESSEIEEGFDEEEAMLLSTSRPKIIRAGAKA